MAFAIAIGFLLLTVFSLAGTLPAMLLWGWPGMQTALLLAVSAWLAAMAIMHLRLPGIFQQRPEIKPKN